VDIADGFYHIWVKAAGVPKLRVLLPNAPEQERLIVFTVVLPMGWKESPPVFTSATKKTPDLANNQIQQGTKHPPHRLELQSKSYSNVPTSQHMVQQATSTSKVMWAHGHAHNAVGKWDVYVDDFIGLAQSSATRRKPRSGIPRFERHGCSPWPRTSVGQEAVEGTRNLGHHKEIFGVGTGHSQQDDPTVNPLCRTAPHHPG
jgi:hypothetical protein